MAILKRIDKINLVQKVGHSLKYPDSIKSSKMVRIQIKYKSTNHSYFYDTSVNLKKFIQNKFKIDTEFTIKAPEKITNGFIIHIIHTKKIE